ncbi:MAG: DUF1801 domain-containing protein [Candidatus Kapaibacterium sp.]
MAELKTKVTNVKVDDFIDSIDNLTLRMDCKLLLKMMKNVTKSKPKMWGESIIGFGDYQYEYSTGRKGDWFLMGFSPRKTNISIYIMGRGKIPDEQFHNLGKIKMGKGCLYIKKMEDINQKLLNDILVLSQIEMKQLIKNK